MTVQIASPRSSTGVLGVRTAYYRHKGNGKGPTLVLMHGSSPGACSELNWYRNFDALAAMGHDVLAFDQPGFGYSDAPQDHSVEFRYQHARALLQEQGVRRAILLGNSLGGLLAVLLQHRVPREELQVDGMVLAAQFPHFEIPAEVQDSMQKHMSRLSSLDPDVESVKRLTANTLADHRFLTDELVQLRLAMLVRNYPAYQARRPVGVGFDSASVRAQPVATPALVTWGMNDNSLPMAIGLEAMKHFSNAQYLFLPRCGHWPQTEHAVLFNRMVHGFAADLAAGLVPAPG
jgi:2-hydroxy-6-oxonona-2,4-dienedioate hydrolase